MHYLDLTPLQAHIHDRQTVILPNSVPHLPPPPENSIEELELIKADQAAAKGDPMRSLMIKMYDFSFVDDFLKLCPRGSGHLVRPLLDIITHDCSTLIMREKLFHNRIRPRFLAKKLHFPFHTYETDTDRNPSYPSFHAAASKIMAFALSDIFPHREDMYAHLAHAVAQSRIDAGVHFPSDIKAGVQWAQTCWSIARTKGLRVENLVERE